MKTTPKRTTSSIFLEMLKELGGEPMKQAFLRDFPGITKDGMVEKELTEAEYQAGLNKMRGELPAFKEYLLQIADDPSLVAVAWGL